MQRLHLSGYRPVNLRAPKKIILGIFFTLVIIAICVGVGMLSMIKQIPLSVISILQLILFGTAGGYYTIYMQKTLAKSPMKALNGWLYTFAVAFALFFLLSALKQDDHYLPLRGGAMLLLPYTIWMAWQFFVNIPVRQYEPWFNKFKQETKAVSFLNSVTIQFKLKKNVTDMLESVITTTIPGRISLGEVFDHFVTGENKQGSGIKLLDSAQELYGWTFFIETFGGLKIRPLNPSDNIIQNGVHSGETICARRIIAQTASTGEQLEIEDQFLLNK